MTQGYYSGLAGMKTYQTAIDVTADNLSNTSTVGFRAQTVEFSSLFEESLNTTYTQDTIGLGSRVNATTTSQEVGSLMLTDSSTDLAIEKDGWFGIQSNGAPLYTRAGNFSFDVNSDLVTTDGYHVLGTMGGNISDHKLTKQLAEVPLSGVDEQVPLSFPQDLTYPPEPTKTVKMIGNIGTDDEIRSMGSGVIDANGDRNDLRLEFTKVDKQVPPGTQWNAVATIKSLDGETTYDTQEEVVSFNEDGSLKDNPFNTIDNNGSPVKIDLGSDYDGVVSMSNYDITSSSIADGMIAGDLQGYEINKNAEVIAVFTNGVQSSVGKVAVYHFQNDQGLERVSGTRFGETSNSGDALFYQDIEGNNTIGTNISNYQLESSNLKTEVALTDLIIMQRAYDANSKSITTADQMMQKALSMDA